MLNQYILLMPIFAVCLGVGLPTLPGQAQTSMPLSSDETITTDSEESTPLKPGDLVRITVVGFQELSGEQVITTSGTIQLPMAGDIVVAGLYPEIAIQPISTALLPYVRRPQVSLTLIEPSPLRVSVTGEVLDPGPRSLSVDEIGSNNVIRLSELLIAAGGITPEADLQNITIRRQTTNSSLLVKTPFSSTIQVDLWKAIQFGDLAADPAIYDGDEIIVPTAITNGTDQQILLASTVAPDHVVVNVAGEVRRPGPVEITPTSDANAAIAAAGGPTPDANVQLISLVRMGTDGQLIQEEFEFGEVTAPIRNGDLIYVKKSSTSNALDFLGAISNPLRLVLDAFILNGL